MRKTKRFTLVELMFVIAILVILIGISWVAGAKVLRSQAKTDTKARIQMIESAIKQYRDRYDSLPKSNDYEGVLDFAAYLSKVPPNSKYQGLRPMFIDAQAYNIGVYAISGNAPTGSNQASNYSNTSGALGFTDPYEQLFYYKQVDNTFKVTSAGLDGDFNTEDDITGE